jgi:branched-chain amino acid transport system ATP-binding protein
MALLEIRDVRAGYGNGPDILTDIDLDVEEGRTYCIIGPNGAGKSTLLKAIAGLLKPRSGSISFDGQSIAGKRPDQVLAAGVCFVPQDRTIFPQMTVRENLVMGGFLLRDRKKVEHRLEELMEIFPILAQRSGQLAQTMSGGEQQMLVTARALMISPRLMMIDEPSLGLAPQISDQIFGIIRQLSSEMGVTVLLIEQNVKKGLEIADWAFVLDLGTKRFEGSADAILDDPRLRDLYLGKLAARTDRDGGDS